MDTVMNRVFTNAAYGMGIPAVGSELTFTPANGTTNIFALIEARAGYTPVAQEVFTIYVEAFRD